MDNFDSTRDAIIKQLHLEALSPEEQNEVLSWLREKVLAKVNHTLSDMLGDADAQAHASIASGEGAEAGQRFLAEKIPNLPYVIDSIAERVLRELGVTFES